MTDPTITPDSTPSTNGSTPWERGRGRDVVSIASRLWGAFLLLVGLWLFASITLHLDLPLSPVRDLWPAGLILVGAAMVLDSSRRAR